MPSIFPESPKIYHTWGGYKFSLAFIEQKIKTKKPARKRKAFEADVALTNVCAKKKQAESGRSIRQGRKE